jgi:hypothetical protein
MRSVTGEGDCYLARLEPPASPYLRQDWSFDWHAVDAGRHTLRARATDAVGNTRPGVPVGNRLGYGNDAVEVIYVDFTSEVKLLSASIRGGPPATTACLTTARKSRSSRARPRGVLASGGPG